MITIDINDEKKRVYIKVSGFITKDEVRTFIPKFTKATKSIDKNYNIISDISEYRLGENSALTDAMKFMTYISNQGFGKIVRVIGSSKAGLSQFGRAESLSKAYKAINVPTLKDAEDLLDKQ